MLSFNIVLESGGEVYMQRAQTVATHDQIEVRGQRDSAIKRSAEYVST